MAGANISVDQDQFTCSVCLDLLKDPVTIPCGHSYCMSCITDYWNQEDQKRIYRYPLCKQTFTPRPVLGKNVVITEMVEKLKKTGHQSAAPEVPHTGSGDVQCDSCTGRKQKAVKSCLECRSSYCQNHLEHHENLFSKRHNLMDATGRLQEMICPQHDKILEIYCRTDQRCICMLCLVDEHKDHDTVSTAAARTEKQSHLDETQRNIQQRIQQKEKDLQQLREAVASHMSLSSVSLSGSTDGFTVSSHLSFDEVVKSVSQLRDKLLQFCSEETEMISGRVKTVQVIQTPEYQTREEFLQCFHLFTLDPNTVDSKLYLSEGNTVITQTGADYRYPDHHDRFDFHAQALCRERISGRCYWEVEYSGSEGVHIAVVYKSIKRKGMRSDSRFGYNNQSWRLYCSNSSCSFRHNNTHTVLPIVSSHRIGVYVDHSAGILSFFSVSDKMSLIHRVQTTFTQPLYAGFGVQNGTTLKLCRLIL